MGHSGDIPRNSGIQALNAQETTVMVGCSNCFQDQRKKVKENGLTKYHSSRTKCIIMCIIEAF